MSDGAMAGNPDLEQIPDRTYDKAREHIDIVYDLAERGPFVDYRGGCDMCALVVSEGSSDAVYDMTNHEPDCLWRRAKAVCS
jgi:hypothetical protein